MWRTIAGAALVAGAGCDEACPEPDCESILVVHVTDDWLDYRDFHVVVTAGGVEKECSGVPIYGYLDCDEVSLSGTYDGYDVYVFTERTEDVHLRLVVDGIVQIDKDLDVRWVADVDGPGCDDDCDTGDANVRVRRNRR